MVEEVSVCLTSFEVDEADRKCIEVQKLFLPLYLYSSFECVFVWESVCDGKMGDRRIWRWIAMVTVLKIEILYSFMFRSNRKMKK